MLAIAHGGGGLRGTPYTNSFEALDASYARGFCWFELDFKRTADGAVGCRHDWGEFGGRAPTLEALRERFAGSFTPVDAAGLAAWMAAHPDATLVTDVKEADQVPVLADLAAAGVPRGRTVVQLFAPEEAARVDALGFARRSIILYRYGGSLHALRRFVTPGTAVGLSVAQALAGTHRRLPGCVPWAYTVNRASLVRHLVGVGVQGVFTDDLAPGTAGLTATPRFALFAYGTLLDEETQRAVLGRTVARTPDALTGYALSWLEERDASAVATSGVVRHRIAHPSPGGRVEGGVLTLTAEELARADAYEGEDYARVCVTLASGRPAWLYRAR